MVVLDHFNLDSREMEIKNHLDEFYGPMYLLIPGIDASSASEATAYPRLRLEGEINLL